MGFLDSKGFSDGIRDKEGMIYEFQMIAGLVVLAIAMRTFGHPVPRKLGALMWVVATFAAGYYLGGSVLSGFLATMIWVLLPGVGILLQVRRLRLPMDRRVEPRFPPSRMQFPGLREMTGEIEAEGFEQVADVGWDWEESKQFQRVFHHPENHWQAGITLAEQGGAAVVFVSLTTRDEAGRIWRTWNYPFSYTMHLPPHQCVLRMAGADNFKDMMRAHARHLEGRASGPGPSSLAVTDADVVTALMEQEAREQVEHNLDRGIILPAGEGTFRYSWRGCFFLWRQFLKDMVRLS